MQALRRAALVFAATGALSIGGWLPASAASGHPVAKPVPIASGQSVTVTLVTGDQVWVRNPKSPHPMVSVTPAAIPGRSVFFTTSTGSGGHISVVPSDMMPLMGSVLDPKLFDVTELISEGYDNAHGAALPLIVQHAAGVRGAAGTLAGASLHTVRELGSIHATAVRELHKDAAQGLGKSLFDAGRAAMNRHRAVRNLGTAGPLAGVTHIWLDGQVKASPIAKQSAGEKAADDALDWNLTKIDAPGAWATGNAGKGVKVAVIDTGIDATHPDLVGKVVNSADFTGSSDVSDHFGHGTHVAGTIAGTGVASDGHRKGVAYEAELLNAKVLGDDGSGTMSGIMAGMEWAAQHGAKVANMSLGSVAASDGKDPISLALNRLTEQYGTLFVVAAGNQPNVTVSAPAAADDALSVGATASDDEMAPFSSPGPRLGDSMLKPEISAPGKDIVQARAADGIIGDPVDQYYTMMSGTSMATPHVAGAAATLALAHPDWTTAQLKAVLQDSSDALPTSVYRAGSGRLNVAQALQQQVVPDRGAFDFGMLDCTVKAPLSRQVTLSNTGDSDATYELDLKISDFRGRTAPAAAASLSDSRITVPTGKSVSVQVTVDPSQLGTGPYSGQVVATPVGDGVPLHLAVALWSSPQYCPVHLSALDRNGAPTPAVIQIMNKDNGDFGYQPIDPAGTTVYMQEGQHFSIAASLAGSSADGKPEGVLLDLPEVKPSSNDHIVLDGRRTHPFSVSIPGRKAAPSINQVSVRHDAESNHGFYANLALGSVYGSLDGGVDLYAGQGSDVPAAPGTSHTMAYMRLNDAQAANRPWTATTVYDLAWGGSSFGDDLAHRLTSRDLSRLARIEADFRQAGAYGDRLKESRGPAMTGATFEQILTAPSHRTDYVTPGMDWEHAFRVQGSYAAGTVDFDETERYSQGEQSETRLGGPFGATLMGRVEDPGGSRNMDLDFTHMASSGGEGLTDSAPGVGENDRRRFVYQISENGEPLLNQEGSTPLDWTVPNIPAEKTDWEVHGDLNLPGVFAGSGTEAHTTWDFSTDLTSAGSKPYTAPLLNLGYSAALDGNNKAKARKAMEIGLTAQRIAGAGPSKVTAMKAAWSTDGGTQWHNVQLVRTGDGRYRMHLPAAALVKGGTVSLHVSARDAGGSSIDQVLPKAFFVTG
ncbi:S8 family peptidase [Streptomyces siamensis]|uniref:S8 family peptidase n=1 Tax=Streptomyces siamensis TaxID=1274986 RepID=UPI0031E862AB